MGQFLVVDQYSHMFGSEVLLSRHKSLFQEILDVLANSNARRTKISEEQGREGQLIFSGQELNGRLKQALESQGWRNRRVVYPGQTDYSFTVDFCKGRVGLEIQFGKYFAVQKDLYNLLYLFGLDEIDVGVIIIPSDRLHREMPSGVGKFSSIITAIKSHPRNDPAFPAVLLGIDIEE